MSNEKFMFYENFLEALNMLPEGEREKACYEFCKFGITGELPEDRSLAMFCIGVSASVRKYDGRGGAREGAGAPKGNKNAVKKQSDDVKQSEIIDCENNQKQSIQSKNSKESEFQKQSEITNINKNINKNINLKKDNINVIQKNQNFKKPTIDEVKQYCLERNNSVNAEHFVDFYTSKGWKVGNQPMKDWKAAVRTWERSSTPVLVKTTTPTKAESLLQRNIENGKEFIRRNMERQASLEEML